MKKEIWNQNTNKRPLIIAGPCSAETREQVMATAEAISQSGVAYFRAGIWKPRTRPGSFEGVGSAGLEWLKEVKTTYGIKTCTEVANVKHVYEALKAGIDMLWIGARTTTNPFAVQEMAEALSGVDIPILVKNPINPDLGLWIGAIERFMLKGTTRIGAIHRGFSQYGEQKYRNEPQWDIPIELQRLNPDLPLICDPSHIAGNRALLAEVSQKAMDLNFDGLMIETHTTPDEAWSDAAQQLTPTDLDMLLAELIIREVDPQEVSMESLSILRNEIDSFDEQLLDILRNRMKTVEKIGEFKKNNDMTILQNSRWSSLLERNLQMAQKYDLDEAMVNSILKAVHQGSINLQERVIGGK
jgi:chorismate mutase